MRLLWALCRHKISLANGHSCAVLWDADIYEKSVRIIRDYFDGEDEEDFDIAPDLDYSSHRYAFGVSGEAASTSADGDSLRFSF